MRNNKRTLLISKPKIGKRENKPRIPLVLKFNRTLPNIKKIIWKHWDLLHISPKLKNVFQERTIMAYKRNRDLKKY